MSQKWSLTALNARLSEPRLKTLFLLGIFCLSLLVFLAPVLWRGELNAPPAHGDGPDYESIALGLHRGQGYARVMDEGYLKPYQQGYDDGRYGYLTERTHWAGTTAARPPLLPIVMAGTYQIFGRQFWSIRILNSLAMAVSCVIFSALLFRQFGFLPTLLFVFFFLIVDSRIRDMASAVMTESFAILLMALMFLSLVRLAQTGSTRASLLSGAFLGLSILNRSVFVLWLPGMILLVALLTTGSYRPLWSRQRIRNGLLFACTALLIPMPWFVRNCVVLESLMPTGTQGPVALVSGFSDWAVKNNGLWKDIPADEPAYQQAREMAGLQREIAMAQTASTETKHWIGRNLWKLPRLTWAKIRGLWTPPSRTRLAIFLPALLGAWIWLRWTEGKIFAWFTVLLTFQVAVTYTHFGRFQIPLLGLTLSAAAIGLWAILLMVVDFRDPLRSLVSLSEKPDQPAESPPA